MNQHSKHASEQVFRHMPHADMVQITLAKGAEIREIM
jgi:hypothetical protein